MKTINNVNYKTPKHIIDYITTHYETEVQIIDPTQGNCAYLKSAMDIIIGNPPFIGEQE